jgi:hypothetical protein
MARLLCWDWYLNCPRGVLMGSLGGVDCVRGVMFGGGEHLAMVFAGEVSEEALDCA